MANRIPEVKLPFAKRNTEGERVCVWCGGPLPKRKHRWCGDKCVKEYMAKKGWDFRKRVLAMNFNNGEYTCDWCGFHSPRPDLFDADHVIAICLGGDPVSLANGHVLCHKCHGKKTKSDMRKLRIQRKHDNAQDPMGSTTLDQW